MIFPHHVFKDVFSFLDFCLVVIFHVLRRTGDIIIIFMLEFLFLFLFLIAITL